MRGGADAVLFEPLLFCSRGFDDPGAWLQNACWNLMPLAICGRRLLAIVSLSAELTNRSHRFAAQELLRRNVARDSLKAGRNDQFVCADSMANLVAKSR
jgi:hypothetical protein